jgi:hypothetical protein
MRIVYKSFAVGLGMALLALLAGCEGTFQASLAISQSFVVSGGTSTVEISIVNPPDAKNLQVGPIGRFTYDPAVITVTSLKGVNGFQVFASTINNVAGEVTFAAGFPGGSVRPIMSMGINLVEVPVVEITFQAIGAAGSSTVLNITAVDVFTDRNGKDIVVTSIHKGEVEVQ